ncbi:MAG: hypothetical protein QNJ41_11055 [Xenococcaceae cyanobacterium MO_188.B32]|nr:hypothetical protein [Xenococcaceae cyanobacterium MO_188.B32]
MRLARSMYLGGTIVSATECDFEDYKRLGLTCPICRQAVYLRSGSIRQQTLRNKKTIEQKIEPYP